MLKNTTSICLSTLPSICWPFFIFLDAVSAFSRDTQYLKEIRCWTGHIYLMRLFLDMFAALRSMMHLGMNMFYLIIFSRDSALFHNSIHSFSINHFRYEKFLSWLIYWNWFLIKWYQFKAFILKIFHVTTGWKSCVGSKLKCPFYYDCYYIMCFTTSLNDNADVTMYEGVRA